MVNKFRRQIDEGSSISNIPQPKFGKIIFSPHELCRLRIPEGFASKYCRNMLNPVYLEVPGGEVWEVEVEHSDGRIWLAQGWKDFSDYYSISRGHFLMFGYNARSHFNVTIFDFSATEIEYPTAEIESDDSIDISDVVGHSSEILRHGPLVEEKKRKRQEGEAIDISNVVEHSSENVRHGPLVEERKRERQEGEAIDISEVVEHSSENLGHGSLVEERKRERQDEEAIDISDVVEHSSENLRHGPLVEERKRERQEGEAIDISDVVEHSSENLRHGPLVEERKRERKEGEAIDISDVVEHSSENMRHGPFVEERKRERQEGEAIDISDVVEHSSENLSHGPLAHERKRKRQEEEAEDDITVNLQNNANGIEEEESQGNAGSLEISEGCEEHEQQSNIVTSESEAERDEEISESYQRAKAFKSKNPFIISFMHPSYVSRSHCLYIPLKFARKYLMQNSGNLVLRVSGRGSWSVKCILLSRDAKVTCGWKTFVLDNKLKYGDVCVLEVINDTKLSLINVTIFPGVSDSTN